MTGKRLSTNHARLGVVGLGPVYEPDFYEPTHAYTHDGQTLPSVSMILRPATEAAYEGIARDTLTRAADLGTAVHACAELWDKGELDEASIEPEWRGYFDAYRAWTESARPEHIGIEWRLCCDLYAGTIDRVCRIRNEFWIVDLKTTSQLHPHVGMQLAAYEALAHPVIIDQGWSIPQVMRRAALQLREDGTYRFKEYKRQNDARAFLALLTFYRWKKETEND